MDTVLDAQICRRLAAGGGNLWTGRLAANLPGTRLSRTLKAMDVRRDRTRAEILVAIGEAEASLARGEGRVITQQSMRDLAAEVKQRGRDRLAAELPPGNGASSCPAG